MDISDRIESRDSLVIPEHLVFAFDDWISELFRRALDTGDEVEGRAAAIKAVHKKCHLAAGADAETRRRGPSRPSTPGGALAGVRPWDPVLQREPGQKSRLR
jgi:hypothetical protein